MIPYVEFKDFSLGPLTIHLFGILVATGVMFGSYMTRKYAARHGVDDDVLRWMAIRVVVIGFIGCHLFDVFLYTPEKVLDDPLIIFKVWEGIASWGGILFGGLAVLYYVRKLNLPPLRVADTFTYGFVPGFMFGRMGCSIAHDHKGVASDFALAVAYPSGSCWTDPEATLTLGDKLCIVNGSAPHHDLGLYDLMLCFAIWIVVLAVARIKNRPPGLLLAITALMYAPARLFFETMRPESTDPRYLWLTPAQWLSIGAIVWGGYLAYRVVTGRTRGEETMSGAGSGELAEKARAAATRSSSRSESKSAKK